MVVGYVRLFGGCFSNNCVLVFDVVTCVGGFCSKYTCDVVPLSPAGLLAIYVHTKLSGSPSQPPRSMLRDIVTLAWASMATHLSVL